MAYNMVDITARVRVGMDRDGNVNIEVWDLPRTDPEAKMAEINIPPDATVSLGKFLLDPYHEEARPTALVLLQKKSGRTVVWGNMTELEKDEFRASLAGEVTAIADMLRDP